MKMETQFIEEIKNPKQFAEALVSSTLNNRKNNDIEKSTDYRYRYRSGRCI